MSKLAQRLKKHRKYRLGVQQLEDRTMLSTWYVRPENPSGNYGANNGASFNDAWNGLDSIGWASMAAGDTLYVSETHPNPAFTAQYNGTSLINFTQLNVGKSGTSDSQRINIESDPLHAGRILRVDKEYEFNIGSMLSDCESGWVTGQGANVTVTHDSTDKKVGANSMKAVVATAATTGLLANSADFTSTDITAQDYGVFWIKADIALNANDLQLVYSEASGGAKTGTYFMHDVPAISAGVWTPIYVSKLYTNGDAVKSVGLYMMVDKGAFTVRLDQVRADNNGWTQNSFDQGAYNSTYGTSISYYTSRSNLSISATNMLQMDLADGNKPIYQLKEAPSIPSTDPTRWASVGKVSTAIAGNDQAYGVAIQSDGKYVVVGHATNANKDFAVV